MTFLWYLSNSSYFAQLFDVKSLKGMVGLKCVLLGVLCQPREGEFALEDTTGLVKMDLSGVETTDGIFTGIWQLCSALLLLTLATGSQLHWPM